MKIVFLTRLFNPSIGGVQKHVLEISRKATENGHKVLIVTERYSEKLKKFDSIDGVYVYRIPIKNQKSRLKKFQIWFWLTKKRVIFREANIIHAHDVGFWLLPLKTFFPKKNFYITFHGYEPNSYKKIKNRVEKKLTEKITNATIAVGSYLKKWYGIKPQKIIYGASSTKNSIGGNLKFDACFVGRLEKDTGILEYLKAINLLKKKYKLKISLVVCGNGSLLKKIKKYIKKNRLPVRLCGWEKNPHQYISKSKIAFSSQYLSIIEALQLKKTVFSVYSSEIKKDYLLSLPISKNIFVSNNHFHLAKNIKNFLEKPNNYKKKTEKSYIWASRQTWENIYKKYLELWGYKQ
ncbi:MAG: glycosyltransferase family 4 protein [Candidatus Shapirobacteria bacterium]|nr:glycosyltransferase family 4 protein [Candidatus Shapirobacteria bacterium]